MGILTPVKMNGGPKIVRFWAITTCRHIHQVVTGSATRNATQRPSPIIRGPHIAIALIALCLCALSPVHAQTMADGSAIVTSRSGSVTATAASGQQVSAGAHTVLQPAGLELSTGQDGQLFITFSNGVALAVDNASSVQCLEFAQRPFDQKDQRIGLESSVSKLRLQFTEGQLAIASNQLSPLSELRILLPQGEIRLHKGTCLIRLDATGLHLTAFEGNLTYYYPDAKTREFISAPKSVRISEQSMNRQQIATASTVESLNPDQIQFCQAAQHASKRVTFQANKTTGLPPVPVLIARPDYFQQPDLRPYQFKD
ncbi:hypothetical protein ACWPKS_01755 [Coraliomargarita sp. W4R72]